MHPINWSDIDTVLLDMDGTLLDLAFDNWFWQTHIPDIHARQSGLPYQDAVRELTDLMDAHLGTLNWYSLDFWTRQTRIDVAACKRAVSDRISLRPHARDLLEELRSRGKRLIMTTNAHPVTLDIKLNKTGIDQYFDALVSSHHYHAAKESPEFWTRLQQQHTFDPARTLLLDDSLPVLLSAKTYGIQHLYCIRQPDSTQAPRQHTDPFPYVEDLIELLA